MIQSVKKVCNLLAGCIGISSIQKDIPNTQIQQRQLQFQYQTLLAQHSISATSPTSETR
jgi:hypothetical protein